MPSRDRLDIQKSLKKKGFIETPGTRHDIYTYSHEGKKTAISTFTSRGSGYKSYETNLLSSMSKHLKLSLDELLSLIDCSLNQTDYHTILKKKQIF